MKNIYTIILAVLMTAGVAAKAQDSTAADPTAAYTIVECSDTTAVAADTLTVPDIEAAQDSTAKKKVYVFPIREDIMPASQRLTDKCLGQALEMDADYVVIDMNTYGGLLTAADSIRTRILNFPKPVYVFINNQAASAGALIAIACDSIYMREGGSIGAATVVNGDDGSQAPDKYQSFMRSMMRSTAESHGKVVVDVNRGDTTWRWFRDPLIAESMVDDRVVVPGLVEEGKVLTLSTNEAIEWHYCEGKASSIEEVLAQAGVTDYEITEYKPTTLDRLLGFLTNPAFQAILIMIIIGGIYFELQTPGVGFPLIAAIGAAVLYFAPLYLEGLLANWELIVFLVGVVLIILEIFVTPGFGVLGITGIVATIVGLAFAAIDTELFKSVPTGEVSLGFILRPLLFVVMAVAAGLGVSFWLGKRFLTGESELRKRVVLTSSMEAEEGYVSHVQLDGLAGREGVAATQLRPSGKVLIDGSYYEAAGLNGQFIDKGAEIVVVRIQGGVLYCRKR